MTDDFSTAYMKRGATGERGATGKWALSLFFSLLALAVALSANIALYFAMEHQTANGRQAHAALCVYAQDLGERITDGRTKIKQSKAFLVKNPNGIFGIPASVLRASITSQEITVANQQATHDAFERVLTCP